MKPFGGFWLVYVRGLLVLKLWFVFYLSDDENMETSLAEIVSRSERRDVLSFVSG